MSEFVFVPLFVILCIAVTLAVYNNIFTVKKYKLSTDKFEGGLRIVLLSDLHNKSYGKDNHRLVSRIASLSPDVIFVTGDTVDRRRPDFDVARTFLKDVSGICDTFAVSGNHERALGVEATVQKLECAHLMIDEEYKIFRDYSLLGLSDSVGTDDTRRRDLLGIFEKLNGFKIVAVHRPTQFAGGLCLRESDVDLVLCGHTHGGAVRIPFFGAILSPDEGFFPKYSKGLYRENGTAMVVSGGLGNTVLPLRINNFPQIVVVDVEGIKK